MALLGGFLAVVVSGQTESRFPGVSGINLTILQETKKVMPFALPTWIPPGFRLEKVDVNLGSEVPIEKKVLVMIYSRKLIDGRTQRFALEAGFEGLGDLPYEATSSVRARIGKIDIAYEPADPDEAGKKLRNFAMTHWFKVGETAFRYDGMYRSRTGTANLAMISLEDTRKIVQSLEKF